MDLIQKKIQKNTEFSREHKLSQIRWSGRWIPDARKKKWNSTYLIFDMDAGSLLDIIEFIIWLNIFFSYFSHFSIIIYGF